MALKDMSVGELKFRLKIVQTVIQECQRQGDERWRDHLDGEQRILNAALVAKIREEEEKRGIPKPEPVVIHADALSMRGVAPKATGKKEE